MKKLKQLLTLALFITAISAMGQTDYDKTSDQPYIEVMGTAEKEVIPDEIYIGIVLKEKYNKQTKVTIDEQEVKLKNAVKSLGIDLKNLYLSDADAGYVKVSYFKKDVLTQKDYTLKVSDAATVGKVFQELDKLEITDASIIKVNHSKLDTLRKEVHIMAIKAAKEKASYLLNAIGEQVGKPLKVQGVEEYPISLMANVRGARDGGEIWYVDGVKDQNLEVYELQFQKIKIEAAVKVRFAIK